MADYPYGGVLYASGGLLFVHGPDGLQNIACGVAADNAGTNQPILIPPNYEAWKHVEKFTLIQASYLWNDLEPHASGNYTTDVKAWINAFCAAIRKGELNFIPREPNDFNSVRYEKDNPEHDTEVSRNDLYDFAFKNDYKPKFLSQQ